jgi:hypothetical protein
LRLAAIFAIVALTLTAVGLYAAMAAFVRPRDREIGIRVEELLGEQRHVAEALARASRADPGSLSALTLNRD